MLHEVVVQLLYFPFVVLCLGLLADYYRTTILPQLLGQLLFTFSVEIVSALLSRRFQLVLLEEYSEHYPFF